MTFSQSVCWDLADTFASGCVRPTDHHIDDRPAETAAGLQDERGRDGRQDPAGLPAVEGLRPGVQAAVRQDQEGAGRCGGEGTGDLADRHCHPDDALAVADGRAMAAARGGRWWRRCRTVDACVVLWWATWEKCARFGRALCV